MIERPYDGCGKCLLGVRRLSRMKLATSSPERQREDVLTAAASVGGHIIGWADDWEVSGAMDPVTRPKLGPWLRDERGPYDGLVAAAVDRIGRNVVDCLNTGYKMRDEGKLLVTYGHEGPWDLNDTTDENRFTMEAWGAQMELRAIQRRNRSATVKTRAAGRPKGTLVRFPQRPGGDGRSASQAPTARSRASASILASSRRIVDSAGQDRFGTSGSTAVPSRSSRAGGASATHSLTASRDYAPARTAQAVSARSVTRGCRTPADPAGPGPARGVPAESEDHPWTLPDAV
ncbi:recombinase family protein [Streptomyces decoyicus]